MKKLLLCALLATQAGCATKLDLSNRISRTEACDKVLVTSMWQFFGISTEVDKRDAEAMLKKCKADQAK